MHHLSFILSGLLAAALPVFASVDSGLMALVPEGTKVVVGLDAQHLKSSGFGQYLLNKQPAGDHDFEEFVQTTGFDPTRDLSYLLITTAGSSNSPGLVFVRGMFDLDRIKAAAHRKGARVESAGSSDLIFTKDSRGSRAIGFPEVGVAVAGATDLVRSVISHRATAAPIDPALSEMINSVSGGNDLWLASVASPTAFAPNLLEPGDSRPLAHSQVLQSIQQWNGGLRFGEMVELTINAVTRSPQDATALADVVRFLSSMVESKAQSDPRDSALVTPIRQMLVRESGPNVHLSMQLPEKTLEEMASHR